MNTLLRSIWLCLMMSTPLLATAEQTEGFDRDRALEHLAHMRRTQWGMMNIARAEGEWFEQLVVDLNAQRVVEIGTSNGYSTIWLALGLVKTKGRLITLEIDEGRYQLARKNFERAGVSNLIDARLTDALEELRKIEGPIDLVFIDAWKDDYPRYLELVLSNVRSGGVIAAHNVDSHSDDPGIRQYRAVVDSHSQLTTSYIRKGRAGIALSTKK